MTTHYARRRAEGRCISCPALNSSVHARCPECRERYKQRHEAHKTAGTCPDCGGVVDNDRSRCSGCLKKKADLYADRKSNGVCVKCGKLPAEPNKHVCCGCKLDNRRRDKKKYRKLRAQVIAAYGGHCQCPGCDVTREEFLQVDHVDNDGASHRRSIGGTNKAGHGFYTWLRKHGFPKDKFQLLCANCNYAKARYGGCPHTKASPE